jgi:hypothetical protein
MNNANKLPCTHSGVPCWTETWTGVGGHERCVGREDVKQAMSAHVLCGQKEAKGVGSVVGLKQAEH